MNKLVKIRLLPGWEDISMENVDGPPTYLNDKSPSQGVLQVSHAEYIGGKQPDPTEKDLIELASSFEDDFGNIEETSSDKCSFGIYGTAIYRNDEFPRSQYWQLSNGKDFITVTYICSEVPDKEEIQEVQNIVNGITLSEQIKSWWKLW